MSWLVETILKSRDRIRQEPNFDSDEYNNLLIIEKEIKELSKHGLISMLDLAILDFVSTNKTYSELESVLGLDRNTISAHFRNICERISFSLGGYFTDEGYLNYMKEFYRLNDEDVEKMREHINGKYRHSIRRSSDD